ncbi:MAG: hypothetical protein Ta2B_10270 [Termitinemataceae bacterium]|nr:MAG: hypothetical protein Ta2B_10270 [Termitinemataceae bacterium]
MLFVPQNNGCAPNNADVYRFSLVEFTPIVKDDGKVTRDYSNPRRYSFLLGREAKVKTPQQYLVQKGRVKDAADLRMRFSVEVLTKEFYGGLFKWYDGWAIKEAAFPEGVGASAKLLKGEENRIHLIRLITRLIFVWFIKQKALIPEWIFDKGEVAKVLKTFKSDSLVDGAYYNGIIQNLFFATLNKPINERSFANVKAGERREDYGIKTVYRDTVAGGLFTISRDEFISRLDPVPFLNGGLFECLDNFDDKSYVDGFSREKSRCAFVPNALFWGDGERLGIIELFNLYNFTVEENTPQDVDVALDPELLGKVFENLLGTFNPETLESARNATGSFYTPREIVSYMVDSSLKEYFKNYLADDADAEEKLEALFSYQDEGHSFSSEQVEALIAAINNSKILDPACGSGAFPMGILQRLVHILGKLDPGNKLWEDIQRKKAVEETEEAYKIGDTEKRNQRLLEISDIFNQNSNDYGRKLFLIENCIYGIDIQPIAIQISKLRFFISLIVNQEKGKNKDDNYGIRPLPNLETKFVAANTLIGLDKAAKDALALQDDTLEALQSELLEIRHQHFIAKTAKEKLSLRKRDKELCNNIMKYVVQNAGKPDEKFISAAANEIKNKKNEIKNLPEIWEDKAAESKLFEEQIDHTLFRVDKNKENRDKLQSDIIRLKEAIKMENEKSVPKGFDNEITKTLNWNPYNQNKSSPFFDPFWMFCVKDGFDVIVGNPPYVQIKQIPLIDKQVFTKLYKSATGRFNLFYLFLENSAKLAKKSGVSTYIVPDRLLLNTQCDNLRSFLLNNQTIIELVSFDESVFESAVVDSVIVVYKNVETIYKAVRAKNKSNILTIASDNYKIIPIEHFTTSPSNQFDLAYDAGVEIIINSIRKNTVLLENIADVKDGIIQSKIPDVLFLKAKKNDKSKKLLVGRDVCRYGLDFNDNWVNYDPIEMKAIERERCGDGKPIGLRLREPAIFERNKILTRQTADEIIACLDTDNYYYANTLHGTTITDTNYLPKYVLAIFK